MTRYFIFTSLALSLLFCLPSEVLAQCPMCKMSAETNLNDGGRAAAGLNKGILYLLVLPYAAMGILGYVWYRNRQNLVRDEQERLLQALLEEHQISLSDGTQDEC